jgi:hypothetical protein
MTHNWNTLIPTPKATNDFGQPILQDYGVDGLFEIFKDWHQEPEAGEIDRLSHDIDVLLGADEAYHFEAKTTSCTVGAQILAVLDDAMPAMLTESKPSDFTEDDVTWWIGADAAIGVPASLKSKVVSIAERGGWLARQGTTPEAFDIIVMPHNTDEVLTGPLSKHGEEYTLWRMVQDSILVDGE